MQEPEVDEALDPGSIDDVYKVTAGKIERSKIQNAYSRVCIHIRGVLTRHGVVALPKQQQTGAKGLDTEIGRASCRERVENSVEAGGWKKKKVSKGRAEDEREARE